MRRRPSGVVALALAILMSVAPLFAVPWQREHCTPVAGEDGYSYSAPIGTGASDYFINDLTQAEDERVESVLIVNDHTDTVILDFFDTDTAPASTDVTTAADFPLLTGEYIIIGGFRYLGARGETTTAPIRVVPCP